jgi:hypothetical protein
LQDVIVQFQLKIGRLLCVCQYCGVMILACRSYKQVFASLLTDSVATKFLIITRGV